MIPAARALLEVLFPPQCAGCPEVGREPFCRLCQEALLAPEPFTIPGADHAAAAYAYGGPVAEAVQRLKYQGEWALGRPLGEAMAARLGEGPEVDIVVPVPLARDRLVSRGYNQARELARGLPRPVVVDALQREPGIAQVGLSREDRLENVRARLAPGRGDVRGRRVLLVDDVVTTGATAEAATAALLDAGARSVRVLALARADDA